MGTQELLSEIQRLPMVEQGKLLAALTRNLGQPTFTPSETQASARRRCIEAGETLYQETLRSLLEPEKTGQYVAIEPDSGQYFLGLTSREALAAAHTAMPEAVFYLARVGYAAAHRIGGERRAPRR